jgi:hypothetical protein
MVLPHHKNVDNRLRNRGGDIPHVAKADAAHVENADSAEDGGRFFQQAELHHHHAGLEQFQHLVLGGVPVSCCGEGASLN